MAAHARHYIYSPVHRCTYKYSSRVARVHVTQTRRIPACIQRGVHISPSLPLRGHKLSEHLSYQDTPEAKQKGHARRPPRRARQCRAMSRLRNRPLLPAPPGYFVHEKEYKVASTNNESGTRWMKMKSDAYR